MYAILCHRQLWTCESPTNKSRDLSYYVGSKKLAELTTKFDMLCMEVHDNNAHIKLNENRIVLSRLSSREKFRAKRGGRLRRGSGRTTLGAPGDWKCGWESGCIILGIPGAWGYGE